MGVQEIARRLGVNEDTVQHWRRRPINFPEPRWTVGGRPAWNWTDIKNWANASGRGHYIEGNQP